MEPFADLWHLAIAVVLLAVNGFFVAAEFSLVKVRPIRLEVLAGEGRPFAAMAKSLADHLDSSLGACQLGITIASIGLGWVGEPAVASLLAPAVRVFGVTSETVLHALSFTVGFSVITAGHLVVGELAPKAFAIRKPEMLAIACAPFLRAFSVVFYPVLVVLNGATLVLVRSLGVETSGESGRGGQPHSEAELRALLSQAHVHGELTHSEHELLDAVFKFDDTICRRVMIPRGDVVWLDVSRPLGHALDVARREKHTRYPVCDGSLDNVLGVVHLKDLLVLATGRGGDLKSAMRRPHYVPETMPVSRLLRYLQAVHQHLAFVVDEYGTVAGIATLDNVLEPIVGSVEEEFDTTAAEVVPAGSGQFLVLGSTPIEVVEEELNLHLGEYEVDTLSGLLVAKLGRILDVGDRVRLPGAEAEVLDIRGARANRIRLTLLDAEAENVPPREE